MPQDSVLIIGYGNSLRSDDGVGRYLAERMAERQFSGVKVLSVHQLTPELAAEMAQVQAVIFIDAIAHTEPVITDEEASTEPPIPEIIVESLSYSAVKPALGHSSNPEALLKLCHDLYEQSPMAWWVTVPTQNFEFGETFSEITQAAIAPALTILEQLIKQLTINK
ncbi:MAG: hydrogenase maturation protease [Snowella sp.]|nr:hydrogenase maturation protease [Snowella sp.]